MSNLWHAMLAASLGSLTVVISILITGFGVWCCYMVDRPQGNQQRDVKLWKLIVILMITVALVVAWTFLSLYVLRRI